MHTVQYFEMFGSRALYQDGWKAVTFIRSSTSTGGRDPDASYEDDIWELYHVESDPSETEDLAKAEPERVAAMVETWWNESG